jgi:hypothetical protein
VIMEIMNPDTLPMYLVFELRIKNYEL